MQRYGHSRKRRRRATRAGFLTLLAALAAVPSADAATRYTTPSATDTLGACTQVSPCQLGHAVNDALAGDTVVVGPGTYDVTYQVRVAVPVTVRGATGQPRPRLVGTTGLTSPTLEMAAAGKVIGLDLETNGEVALQISDGARADAVSAVAHATSATAVAVRMVGAAAPTVLVNSVARTDSANLAIDVIDGVVPGAATITNVTAFATGTGSWAIASEALLQAPVVKNTIARGDGKDIAGYPGALSMVVSNSNFRPGSSSGYTDAGGNQSAAPVLADEAAGDYRELASSPTIDAGAVDTLLTGSTDLAGGLRTLGSLPDIGAFEFKPPAAPPPSSTTTNSTSTGLTDSTASSLPKTSTTDLTTALPPLAPPVLAKTVAVERSSGSPRIQLPGSDRFVALTAGAAIPVGATIDASRGTVSLSSVRDATGKTQTGRFWGGVFQVNQTRGKAPMTELVLKGADFSRCPKAKRAAKSAVGARARHAAVVRRLWGRDKHGRFRTKGRNAHATVRGTEWLVEDRCDGTLTKVRKGAVMVRDLVKRRNVLVRAGHSYLARSR